MSSHKSSDDFEKELDEFFKERAEFRAKGAVDSAKLASSKQRDDDYASEDIKKALDPCPDDPNSMSGCCMTGCSDCPWAYQLPPEKD